MTITYPSPEENELCKCYPDLMKAFFCQYGHAMECHYPMPCDVACCSHLEKYGFTESEIAKIRKLAEAAIAPFYDLHGNIATVRR